MNRLNRWDSLGQLTKLRINQGCQRVGIIGDVWEADSLPRNEVCWRNNLVCRVIIKEKNLGINIRTESKIWIVFGHGTRIQELVKERTWKKNSAKIGEDSLIYVNQLLDLDGERMITWQQYKGYRGLSSKGKKAEWFKNIEAKALNSSDSREVKESFKTRSNNTQALKVEWEKI